MNSSSPDHFFLTQKRILRRFGLDIEGRGNIFYKLYSAVACAHIVLIFMTTIIEFFYLKDLEALSNVVAFGGALFINTIKWISMYVQGYRVNNILAFYENALKKYGNDSKEVIMESLRTMTIHFNAYRASIYVGLSIGYFGSCFTRLMWQPEQWQMPFVSLTYIGVSRSPHFEIISTLQMYLMLFTTSATFGVDTTLISLLGNASLQFKLVKASLNKMKKGMQDETVLKDDFKRMLKDCLSHHIEVLKVVEEIEDLTTHWYSSMFAVDCFVLCFVMYVASMTSVLSWSFGMYCMFFMVIITQLFMFCYWGDHLTQSSADLAEELYDMYRPEDSTKLVKDLIFILARTQKTVQLTAGRYVPLSLRTFASVLRGSFSYFAFLRNLNSQNPNLM